MNQDNNITNQTKPFHHNTSRCKVYPIMYVSHSQVSGKNLRILSTGFSSASDPRTGVKVRWFCGNAIGPSRRKVLVWPQSKFAGVLNVCYKEGNVLFNDVLTTFYLRLYGVRHMVKGYSDSEKGNPRPPHRLLFPISSKGSFICTIPQTG